MKNPSEKFPKNTKRSKSGKKIAGPDIRIEIPDRDIEPIKILVRLAFLFFKNKTKTQVPKRKPIP